MFWGGIIKEGAPLKSQKLLETSEFAVLHLSAAVLAKTADKKTLLLAKNGKEADVCIAALSDKRDSAKLDLYINCTQNVNLSVRGPGEVHLSGYFEPKGDDMDDDMFYGQEDGDEEEDSDEAETAPASKAKALEKSLRDAKANSNKNASRMLADDSDESDDEEAEDLEDVDLEALESDSEDEAPVVHQKKQGKSAPAVVEDSDDDLGSEDMDLDDQLADDMSDSEEEDLQALMAKAKKPQQQQPKKQEEPKGEGKKEKKKRNKKKKNKK